MPPLYCKVVCWHDCYKDHLLITTLQYRDAILELDLRYALQSALQFRTFREVLLWRYFHILDYLWYQFPRMSMRIAYVNENGEQ